MLLGRTSVDIAANIERSPRTVYRIVKRFEDTGLTEREGNSTCGHKPAIDEFLGSVSRLLLLTGTTKGITRRPQQIKYLYDTNLPSIKTAVLSFSTINSLHLYRATMSPAACKFRVWVCNQILRANHAIEIAAYTQEQLVFLDESAVDERRFTKICEPLTGTRAVQEKVFGRLTRWSVLLALTTEGLEALRIVQGSFNDDQFAKFINEELLPIVGPFPGRNSVIVLDNCRLHHEPRVAELLVNQHGYHIVFSPPYPPDLNPVELHFSMMKAWMKSRNSDPDARLAPPSFICKAIDYINTDVKKIRSLCTRAVVMRYAAWICANMLITTVKWPLEQLSGCSYHSLVSLSNFMNQRNISFIIHILAVLMGHFPGLDHSTPQRRQKTRDISPTANRISERREYID
ncbi:hypothetical protein G7K_3186-t1 [Saitoella complicata NRRL Y-17804]|uniref:Tc1-like transposase DDE domain-containing protein n=2 Tax=Saitoella complicata (strain BCRC 22490 / CBS 7301 / JCM 7358 / NBRC 10748 / NRRL Y-17804) TaxID=698492 RepID=A0A0E9NHZ1_SAICN|nr:hypothetical protein G7K_3186-t1 [Saitoella complicata NRRL Y-17804]